MTMMVPEWSSFGQFLGQFPQFWRQVGRETQMNGLQLAVSCSCSVCFSVLLQLVLFCACAKCNWQCLALIQPLIQPCPTSFSLDQNIFLPGTAETFVKISCNLLSVEPIQLGFRSKIPEELLI